MIGTPDGGCNLGKNSTSWNDNSVRVHGDAASLYRWLYYVSRGWVLGARKGGDGDVGAKMGFMTVTD